MINISEAQITAELVDGKWHRKVKRYDSKMEIPAELRDYTFNYLTVYSKGLVAASKWLFALLRAKA